jgi:phage portal protein BeeE
MFGSTRRQLHRAQATASLLEDRLAEVVEARALGSTATVAALPTTIAARALIADAAGMLPVLAVRDGATVTPTPSLLVRPDPTITRRRWVHRAAMSLTGWGNLYVRPTSLAANEWPLAAEVLHPDAVSYITDPLDPWRVDQWSYAGAPVPDLVHVPLWELDLGPVARSPLHAAQAAFDDLAYLWGFAVGYWRDGGKPPYALHHPSRLDPAQAGEALDQWMAARRSARPGLITGAWSIQDLSMPSAQDALLLDGLAYIDQELSRLYHVPPTLLNVRAEQGSLTYSNAVDEVHRWLSLSLYPMWLARIEDAFTMMTPRGQQAQFDTAALGAIGMARPGPDATATPSGPAELGGEATPPPAGPAPTLMPTGVTDA